MSPLIGSPRSFFRSGVAGGGAYDQLPPGYIVEAKHTYNAILPTPSTGWLSFAGSPDFIGSDPTAPTSPDSVCQQSWPAGTNGGVGSWNHAYTFQNYQTLHRRGVHVGLTFWYSPNWVTNLAAGQKIFFINCGDGISPHHGGGQFYLWTNGSAGLATGPMSLTMRFQDMPADSRNATPGNGWNADQEGANGNLADRSVVRGQWARCQIQIEMNDIGLQNGIARMWQSQNGGPFNLVQNFTDVVWLDDTRTTDRYFRGVNYTSVYGGGTTTNHPLQSLRFDETQIATIQ